MKSAAPLALTMGEPAGIGGEIALKAWLSLSGTGPAFVAIDDPARLSAIAVRLGLDVPVRAVSAPADALRVFAQALPVLPLEGSVTAVPGKPDPVNAKAVIASIDRAVALTRAGAFSAVVTNPIQKSSLYAAGFKYPGHTEYLGALSGVAEPVMMLACPELRVVPVTIHMSLRRAIDELTIEAIIAASRIVAAAMKRDFGIARPRLAVAGLNPHAGEDGAMGDEDSRIVRPAIDALRAEGFDVVGPLPPDTMFGPRARQGYDAAICMYHDQALIPLKTLDVDGGVNVTLGLPFVRTSPDHGTALDIAGQGIAHPGSLIAALHLAAQMAERRSQGNIAA
jgi:4-hydroxythreonine-4-phosphate dehydrogenase